MCVLVYKAPLFLDLDPLGLHYIQEDSPHSSQTRLGALSCAPYLTTGQVSLERILYDRCSFDHHFTDKKTESRETEWAVSSRSQSRTENQTPVKWFQIPLSGCSSQGKGHSVDFSSTLRLHSWIKKVGRWAIICWLWARNREHLSNYDKNALSITVCQALG